jgi:hypothetical protein
MKVLVLDRILPGATEAKIKSLMKAEVAHAWGNYVNGTIREWYFRLDRPGAVIVLECASLEEARRCVNALPLAKAGLLAFECVPLGPFVPLTALFADAPGTGLCAPPSMAGPDVEQPCGAGTASRSRP